MEHRVTEPLGGGQDPPQLLTKAVLPQVRNDAQHLAQQSSQQLCGPTQHFLRFKRNLLTNHMHFKQKGFGGCVGDRDVVLIHHLQGNTVGCMTEFWQNRLNAVLWSSGDNRFPLNLILLSNPRSREI